jgi:TctA family transporter
MDPTLLMLALAGGLAGALAMALPGIHVNALALATLALAPASGERGVAFLLGAIAGAPFGLALSTTLLGASEDTTSALPAHQLAREGRAAEAIARLCWGAFAGLALALALALAVEPALVAAGPRLDAAMPILLLCIVAALVLSERARPPVHARLTVVAWGERRLRGVQRDSPLRVGRQRVLDPHGLLDARDEGSIVEVRVERAWTQGPLSRAAGWALALGVLAVSGALGLVTLRMGARSPLGLPGSPLLPLLAGLFAVPGLVAALRAPARGLPRARLRVPRPRRGEILRAAAPGAAASALLGLAPGVTASHVSHFAYVRWRVRRGPRRTTPAVTPRARTPEVALLTLGAVNGGAAVFGALAWRALGHARHGALVAAKALAPPPGALDEAAFLLAGAGLACLAVRAATGRIARAPVRPLAAAGLTLVVTATLATTGAWGLAVLAAAASVGALPPRLHVRRGLCMGAILVPALLRAWGVA